MNWPLNDSNFTFLDRLKIAGFFLNRKNFWTMANYVEKYEEEMRQFIGCKHAVFVSSGSTANTLLAMYAKDNFFTNVKNVVVFPSTTWITSVSPFIREGFTPHFIDINLENLGIDINYLEEYLKVNYKKVALIFITSLLGFAPDIKRLKYIEKKYNVRIMLDNCESTFTKINAHNISSSFTSTTSTYFGHVLQSVEGGFVFTNNTKEYEYFLMARNHGMVRSLKNNSLTYRNPDVDCRFDFNLLGNNFRNTNINAFIGLLDLKRAEQYIFKRRELYQYFISNTEKNKFILPVHLRNKKGIYDVPFCIPLIFLTTYNKLLVESFCKAFNIETRPIISGNLLRQTCLKKYLNNKEFTNSDFVHSNGFYVGLNNKTTTKHLDKLIKILNAPAFIC